MINGMDRRTKKKPSPPCPLLSHPQPHKPRSLNGPLYPESQGKREMELTEAVALAVRKSQ
jgi:hypothetical protein